MTKKDKVIIVYIKNNELKTATINKFNEKKYLNEIFDIKITQGITYYVIKKDISLLHLKNYVFPTTKIKISPEELRMGKTLILENCSISNDFNIKRIKNLTIKNPKVQESEYVYLPRLKIYSCNKVNINLNELKEKISICCSICVNLNLFGNDNLTKLNLDGISSSILTNVNYQLDDTIYSKELTLNNSTIWKQNIGAYHIDKLNLINSQIINEDDCYFYTDEIYLENSSITSESNLFYSQIKKIQFNDKENKEKSYIESSNSINLLNRCYKNTNNKVVTLEQKDIERILSISNLISVYKTIYNYLEEEITKEIKIQEELSLMNIEQEETTRITNLKKEYEEKRKEVEQESIMRKKQKLKLKIKEKY